MRQFALLAAAFVLATPAAAEDYNVRTLDPIVLAQLQGPSVIRAPRYVTNPNAEAEPRTRKRRAQRQRRNHDADVLDEPRTPEPRYARRPQPQYVPEQRPGNLGGGFIEFLVTGRSGPAYQAEPRYPTQAPQGYYYGPRTDYLPQHERQPMHVARTNPTEQPEAKPMFDPRFARTEVAYDTKEAPGTIVIDTRTRYLYLVQPEGRAIRYGVGVGRPGFEWKGVKTVSAMKEWPDWRPPKEMRLRQPHLPVHMAGGPQNPLGARALYLGSSLYRIHGSNEPHTIGSAVSSGCIRMRNQDVIDLYNRVKVGTRVIVI